MEKNRTFHSLDRLWIKLLFVMRLTIFLFFAFVVGVQAKSYSQTANLTLNLSKTKLVDVLNEIEKQSDYFFYYNLNLDNYTVGSIIAKNKDVEDVLDMMLNELGLTYEIVDRYVVIKQAEDGNKEAVVQSSQQQQKTVSGKVTDSSGGALPGATVLVKGTTIGTVTDSNGNYSLSNVPANAILQFSFVGMKMQEVAISGKSTLNVTMLESVIGLEEVVAVGYGTQRRLEVTSAVSTIRSDDFIKGSAKDAAQLIQGKVAGLIIGTPSGDPNSPSQILLRGIATLATSTQPLILIDGIPGGLNTVPPEQIESIDVLKDGSSAAIYGTRGTNGVILITTKRASGEIEPTIDYNSYISTQSFVNPPRMLTAEEYRAKLAEGVSFQDFGSSTDWRKEMSRKNPLTHNQNLTIRGGNAKTNYLASLGYRQQEGILINSESRTFNSRFDVNHSMFNDKLKININYINSDNKSGPEESYFYAKGYRMATRTNPTMPLKNPDGTWYENNSIPDSFNPVAWLKEEYGDNKYRSTRVSGSLTWSPVNDLNLKMLVSSSQNSWMNSLGRTKNHYVSTQNGENGEATKSFGQSADQLMELTTSYDKTIKLHKFSAIVGYSYQHNLTEDGGMFNYNFPAGNYSYIDAIGAGSALKNGLGSMWSSKYASNLIGFFGRLTYNYKEKYLLMVNLRHEASSRFVGTKEPWGTFPAVSLGWRISEENFMKTVSFVDNLKLRAGYGVTGTAPDALFLGVSRLGYSSYFPINGEWVPGLSPISNPNPYLKWEEKKETNIGLDFAFLKQRISGSIDYYHRETDGLLFDYQVPSPPNLYGVTKANVGVMTNKGLEALINLIPVQSPNFTWNSSITYSKNKNKLVSLDNDLYKLTNPFFDTGRNPGPINTTTHRVEVGQPIGNFYGYKVIDVTEDGYWIYEDRNGKPALYEAIKVEDRKVIGNGLPKSYLSWNNNFRYGNFDLDISMRGAFGFQIINTQRMLSEVPGFTVYNQSPSAYEKVFGKAVLNKNVYPDFNSYYVENGDYWKIDNVTIGYSFNISGTKHIKSARLYISTLNTLVITGYKGMDPEVNQLGLTPGFDDRDKYPSARVYTLGLKISFK